MKKHGVSGMVYLTLKIWRGNVRERGFRWNSQFYIFKIYLGLVIMLIILQSGYNKIQDLNNEILDQHLMSNNEMEKSNLMNVYHRGNNLSYLSACGFFEISKSSLTSMLSVRWDKMPTNLQTMSITTFKNVFCFCFNTWYFLFCQIKIFIHFTNLCIKDI